MDPLAVPQQPLGRLRMGSPLPVPPVLGSLFNAPLQEHCLGCQVLTIGLAQCRHCKGAYCSDRCKKQDSQLHICENFDYNVEASLWNVKNPTISRFLSIPYTATFEELHEALQIAFSWNRTTNYEFAIGRARVASAERIEMLALSEEDKAAVDEFKDGRTTYIVEFMKNVLFDRKILGYMSGGSSGIVHVIKIRPGCKTINRASPNFRCLRGYGHPFAEGFDVDEWDGLKEAYNKNEPTTEEKALIEIYEGFCPNADPYGLRGNRANEFNIGAVNAGLKKVSIGLNTFPDHFRRIWLGPEDELVVEQTSEGLSLDCLAEQSSLLELAFKDLSADCLDAPIFREQGFKELSFDGPEVWMNGSRVSIMFG